MSEQHSVVARFLNGDVLKGITNDFEPDNEGFNIYPLGSNSPSEVRCSDLKALFFVKSFMGDSDRHDVRSFMSEPGPTYGVKIAVRFQDGEIICGYTDREEPKGQGFFVLPAGSTSNNRRAYVFSHATDQVKTNTEAELMVRPLLGPQAA